MRGTGCYPRDENNPGGDGVSQNGDAPMTQVSVIHNANNERDAFI
jgi:hypothetical protein